MRRNRFYLIRKYLVDPLGVAIHKNNRLARRLLDAYIIRKKRQQYRYYVSNTFLFYLMRGFVQVDNFRCFRWNGYRRNFKGRVFLVNCASQLLMSGLQVVVYKVQQVGVKKKITMRSKFDVNRHVVLVKLNASSWKGRALYRVYRIGYRSIQERINDFFQLKPKAWFLRLRRLKWREGADLSLRIYLMKNGWLSYQDYKRVGAVYIHYKASWVSWSFFGLRLCLVLINAGFFDNLYYLKNIIRKGFFTINNRVCYHPHVGVELYDMVSAKRSVRLWLLKRILLSIKAKKRYKLCPNYMLISFSLLYVFIWRLEFGQYR